MSTTPYLAHRFLTDVETMLDEVPAPGDVKPGWIALGLVVGLFLVTILLWLSMRKQLRRISFDDGVDRTIETPTSPFVPGAPDRFGPGERPRAGTAPRGGDAAGDPPDPR